MSKLDETIQQTNKRNEEINTHEKEQLKKMEVETQPIDKENETHLHEEKMISELET